MGIEGGMPRGHGGVMVPFLRRGHSRCIWRRIMEGRGWESMTGGGSQGDEHKILWDKGVWGGR